MNLFRSALSKLTQLINIMTPPIDDFVGGGDAPESDANAKPAGNGPANGPAKDADAKKEDAAPPAAEPPVALPAAEPEPEPIDPVDQAIADSFGAKTRLNNLENSKAELLAQIAAAQKQLGTIDGDIASAVSDLESAKQTLKDAVTEESPFLIKPGPLGEKSLIAVCYPDGNKFVGFVPNYKSARVKVLSQVVPDLSDPVAAEPAA